MRLTSALLLAATLMACRHKSDDDGDGSRLPTDCDDTNADIFPGADETCDDVDNNCDGLVDNDATDQVTVYGDGDGDGYGNSTATFTGCASATPEGFVADNTDCDDTQADIHPDAKEDDCTDETDYNCDRSVGFADVDADGFPACKDCDDSDQQISPIAVELCDGDDNNCDGNTDEDGAANAKTWYADADADGYGDPATTSTSCEAPTGFVEDDSDCNDADIAISPDGSETCDDVDQNCNGVIDDGASDQTTWYADADGDTYGSKSLTLVACDQPAGYVATSTDCSDVDADTYPTATELCDGADNDCDGLMPTDEADADDDGTAACDGDCDDADPDVGLNAPELCDGADNDCDGATDEGDAIDPTAFYADNDGDGYGTSTTIMACAAPSGWTAQTGDCDDAKAVVNPGMTEACDTLDNDCDGNVDGASVVGTAAACAATQCKDILDQRSTATDGVYWITGNRDIVPFQAYCDMAGGGWTLALKANGANTTFRYDAAIWTDGSTLRSTSLSVDRTEAKLMAFNKVGFDQVRAEFEAPIGTGPVSVNRLTLPVSGTSLTAVFASGTYVPTSLGRTAWKATITGSSLQPNCNREGLNATGPGQYVRIGMINNQENDCNSPDSRLGIGGMGANCGTIDTMSVGNTSRCGGDNGDKDISAFGYVWVRCNAGPDSVGDGTDQSCDGVDGVDRDGDGEASLASGGPDCDDWNKSRTYAGGQCTLPASCRDILAANPASTNGLYVIGPDAGKWARTYCDMTRGGWTLVFSKNTRHTTPIYTNAGNKFGAGYVTNNAGVGSALAQSPNAASTASVALNGWLDMNTFPATDLRLTAHENGAETYVSDNIAVTRLRIPFGNNGYYLYNAPANPPRADNANYSWCGGDAAYTDGGAGQVNTPTGAPTDCKNHGSLGSGWDFSFSGTGANQGLTLCGGLPASNWMYTQYAANPITYPTPGGAQAIWMK